MKPWQYIKDKTIILLLHFAGMFFLGLFLLLIDVPMEGLGFIAVVWCVVLLCWFVMDYRKRKHYFQKLFTLLEELDQPYLIAEVMDASWDLEDQLYRELLRISNRSVIEKIHDMERKQREYKEYIEGWIHEVKLPLTAAKLMCDNGSAGDGRKLQLQLDAIEKKVEQVLYYARMEQTYEDYLIHKVNLREVVLSAIAANKVYFIQNHMQIHLELEEENPVMVSTDEKWVEFLLTQIFSNAIKYTPNEPKCIRIYTQEARNQISLVIEDNGIGIPQEDISRIFQKGFTGKNGRIEKKSTGMGLYLCKGLCNKLGIGITCQSEEGQYTRMILSFPDLHL